MTYRIVLACLFAICLGTQYHASCQIVFERAMPGNVSFKAIQHSNGSYFLLSENSGGGNFITKISKSGDKVETIWPVLNETYPFYSRITGMSLYKDGVVAVGDKDGNSMVIFTCDLELANRRNVSIAGKALVCDIIGTKDGGFIVFRKVDIGGGVFKSQLVKLDATLSVLWMKDIANMNSQQDLYETSNGDIIITGNTSEGVVIITSSEGVEKSRKNFTNSERLYITASNMVDDKLFLIGKTQTSTDLVKMDQSGNVISRNVLDVLRELMTGQLAVSPVNGRIAFASYAGNGKHGFNLYIYDAQLNLVAERYVEYGSWDTYTSVRSMCASDDGFLLMAHFGSPNAVNLAMKTDFNGSSGAEPPFIRHDDVSIETASREDFNWLDIDNDGTKELLVAGGTLRVFSFDAASTTFKQLTNPMPGENIRSVSLGDFNNDGYIDVFANCYFPGVNGGFPYAEPNILFKNNGNGTFTPVTETNINDPGSATLMSYWVDINNDGWVDLFTVNNGRDRAFMNNGDDTFTAMDMEFEQKIDWIYGTTYEWLDINKDGYIDYISTQNAQTDVMLNIGGKSFEKHAFVEFFDIIGWQMLGSIQKYIQGYYQGKKFMLVLWYYGPSYYEYEEGMYRLKERPAGLGFREDLRGGVNIDFDNDGDLDLYLNNGGDNLNRNDNEIGFTFHQDFYGVGSTFTVQDVDGNGSPDILGSSYTKAELRTNTSTGNWIAVELHGVTSNSFGVNSLVQIKTNGKWREQVVTMHGGSNGKVEYEATFGLGQLMTVDSIRVLWPSGCVSKKGKATANAVHEITEGCSGNLPLVNNIQACVGGRVIIPITSEGNKFKWFTSLTSEPFAVSGKELIIDTLSTSTTLFVSNADSSLMSRRVPVHITISPPKRTSIDVAYHSKDNVVLSIESDVDVVAVTWSVDGIVKSNELTYGYSMMDGDALICATITLEGGCVYYKCYESIYTSTEDDYKRDVNVSPNPFNTVLNVSKTDGTISSVEIVDASGRVVLRSHGKSAYEFDTGTLAPGMYFLKAGGKHFKIVKY